MAVQSDANSVFKQAMALHRSGDVLHAAEYYRLLLKSFPAHPQILYLLGTAELQLGRFADSEALLARALELTPDHAEAWSNRAIALQNLGRLPEALAAFDRAVAVRPDYAEGWFNRGNLLRMTGKMDEALDCYDRAIALVPSYAKAHNNRANVLKNLGRFAEALHSYDQALQTHEPSADIYNNRGTVLKNLGRLDEALDSYDRAIALEPANAQSWHNRGNALRQMGRSDLALESYEQALKHNDGFAVAWCSRGNLLRDLKRPADALTSFDKAIALDQKYAAAWCNRANALRDLKRPVDALHSCDTALALHPDYAEAHVNRGNAFKDMRRYDKALACYDAALALNPTLFEALNNRANTLRRLMRLEEALTVIDAAIAAHPNFSKVYSNRGNVLIDLGRLDEAGQSLRHAIELDPSVPAFHWNLALLELVKGNFAEGWKLYEWRWKRDGAKKRDFGKPVWLGEEPLAGKRLLIHAEQGYGDTIQFARYVPMAVQAGAEVVFEVQKSLRPLMAGIAGCTVINRGDPLPEYDLHVPVMSLPLAFGTTLQTVPAQLPYLAVDDTRRQAWAVRLGPKTAPRIGLAWSGKSEHNNDLNRSIALERLAPLLALPFEFHVLQNAVRPADQAALERFGQLRNYGASLTNFAETAALAGEMDLVIAVDTSLAHLAGALGVPTWVLIPFAPDWRWMTGRTDSPWYPTARLYRQPALQDWDSVIAAVCRDVQAFLPVSPLPQGKNSAAQVP